MAKEYDYNIIYNKAHSPFSKTPDTELSLKFTEHLVRKLSQWRYAKGYYYDRDALPGRNVFKELFRVIKGSTWTIVLLTPGFQTDCWHSYASQSAFKTLLEKNKSNAGHKGFIPISLNVGKIESPLPEELCSEHVLNFTDKWENGCDMEWSKLKRVLDAGLTVYDVKNEKNETSHAGSTEFADDLKRTDRGILLANPSSEDSGGILQHEAVHKTALGKCYSQLVREMDSTIVLDYMMDAGLLPQGTITDIRGMHLRSDKNRFVIDNVMDRGPDVYDQFKDCLIKATQGHLVDSLESVEDSLYSDGGTTNNGLANSNEPALDEIDTPLQDLEIQEATGEERYLQDASCRPDGDHSTGAQATWEQQSVESLQKGDYVIRQQAQVQHTLQLTRDTSNLNGDTRPVVPPSSMTVEDSLSVSMPVPPKVDDQTQTKRVSENVSTNKTSENTGSATAVVHGNVTPNHQQTTNTQPVPHDQTPEVLDSQATSTATRKAAEAAIKRQTQHQMSLSRDADLSLDNGSVIASGQNLSMPVNLDSPLSVSSLLSDSSGFCSTNTSPDDDTKLVNVKQSIGAGNQNNNKEERVPTAASKKSRPSSSDQLGEPVTSPDQPAGTTVTSTSASTEKGVNNMTSSSDHPAEMVTSPDQTAGSRSTTVTSTSPSTEKAVNSMTSSTSQPVEMVTSPNEQPANGVNVRAEMSAIEGPIQSNKEGRKDGPGMMYSILTAVSNGIFRSDLAYS